MAINSTVDFEIRGKNGAYYEFTSDQQFAWQMDLRTALRVLRDLSHKFSLKPSGTLYVVWNGSSYVA